MPTINKSPESFNFVQARDWASRIATHLLADVRDTAIAAVADALGSPDLRDRVAQLVRDELAQRERDLVEHVFFAERTSD
jgi:hypothetical protein